MDTGTRWVTQESLKENRNDRQQTIFITQVTPSTNLDSGLLQTNAKSILIHTGQQNRCIQNDQNVYEANNCIANISNRNHSNVYEQYTHHQQIPQNITIYTTTDGMVAKRNDLPNKNNIVSTDSQYISNNYNHNNTQKNSIQLQQLVGAAHSYNGGTDLSNVTTINLDRLEVTQPISYTNYTVVNHIGGGNHAKCEACGLMFLNATMLNHHKRTACDGVAENTTYQCSLCSATFVDTNDMKKHMARRCVKCNKEVCTDNITFKKNKPFACNFCLEQSNGEKNGKSQERNDVPLVVASKSIVPFSKRKSITTVRCQKCNGSGIIVIGVRDNVSTCSGEKPFQCNECGGKFSRYSSLWSHKQLHLGEKPYKCEVCNLEFAKSAYLKNHSRVHTGEKPFSCAVCGLSFSQSPHLKNHERIHSGERPYQCEVCDKTFARHSTLWNHRRIHTGEKPYRCDICGSAFNQATHLKNHGRVHTGEKPFICDICHAGFSDKFALKRHRAIHDKYHQTANTRQNNNCDSNIYEGNYE